VSAPDTVPGFHTIVVGAGFSGLGAAIKLREAGFEDWVVLEDGDGVGGTWHWNTYPGVAVDIPSFSYQFSFAQRADWSRTYAPGSELKRYADDLADHYGLRDRIRLRTRVERAAWDEDSACWRLELRGGERLSCRYLVNATGVLTTPRLPDIPGIDTFEGTALHTSRWDHDLDLTGQRVAVIGTGASAVQVIPEIAPDVAELTVFQRTPIWCFPKPDWPLPAPLRLGLRLPGARTAARVAAQSFVEVTFPIAAHYHRWFPLTTHMEKLGKRFLAQQVEDPETRAKLTPAYGVGCKRPSFHNTYLATYNQPHVHLETTTVAEVTPRGVRTTDGTLHEVDVLVLATGFQVLEGDNIPTFELVGREGTLAEFWEQNRLQAYQGVSVPGFPNFFTVFGPYGYNGSSYFALIEAQVHHIVRCLRRARRVGAARVEVSVEANDRYFAEMLRRRGKQVFWQDSCTRANSYYFDKHGDVALRPNTTLESVWHSRRFPLEDYEFTSR
jgi:cation diffusion facilitator CzcD-associated flavoprotein CzcO